MTTLTQAQEEIKVFENLCLDLDMMIPKTILDKMTSPKLPIRYFKTLIALGVFDGSDGNLGRVQAIAYAAAMLSATNGSWNFDDFKTPFFEIMKKLIPELTDGKIGIEFVNIIAKARLIRPY